MSYVEIPLTHGLVALVDSSDEPLVAVSKWQANRRKHTAYAQRVCVVAGRRTSQMMHTLITGFPLTDHINGDGLDNRRANLRAASSQQNHANSRVRQGSSQFKGVYWARRDSCWHAGLKILGRSTYIGRFDDESAAALAYDEAARVHFGAFAALNFPRPGERAARSS